MQTENIFENFKEHLIILIILVIGITIRVLFCLYHFTHIDDIGIAGRILLSKGVYKINEFQLANEFKDFWTYAPLQSILTAKLVQGNFSYKSNIFWGRIPSLLCGILLLLVIMKIFYELNGKTLKKNYALIIVLIITSFSYENIIYSSQMEPYEIGVLISSLIIYLLIKEFWKTWKGTIVATIFLSLACYAQYQVYILVFALYIATFFTNIKNRKNCMRVVFAGIANFCSSLPLIIYLFSSGKLNMGLNAWNIGIDGRFAFSFPQEGFFNQLFYIIKFFLENFFLCFKYNYIADSFEVIADITSIILMGFFVYGMFIIHRQKKYRLFAMYCDIVFVVMIFLILKGSLTFGPSRHILIFTPIWLCVIGIGIKECLSRLEERKKTFALAILLVSITMNFIVDLPEEISSRKNYLSENIINKLAEKYTPEFVWAFSDTPDLYLFNLDGYINNSEPTGRGWLKKVECDIDPEIGDNIMILSRSLKYSDLVSNEYYLSSFQERIDYFGLNENWKELERYKIVYQKEIDTNAEVEYARDYYNNFPNGLHVYILEYQGN